MYKLKTKYNDKGNEILARKKRDGIFVYEVQDHKGITYTVDKDWLYFHKNSIINLGIKSDGRIFAKNDFSVAVWDYWCYYMGCQGQGKMTISKVLREYMLEDLSGLKRNGYDGIIIKNAPVGIKEKRIIKEEIIVFNPNQIKSVYNLRPRKTNSIFDGFKPKPNVIMPLTQEQMEYFKYTKIRSNSSLKICYHSTNEVFDSFDINRVGEGGGSSYGSGFYFSSEVIEEYGKPMEVFLNVRRPYVIEDVDNFEEVLRFLWTCNG